MFLRSFIGIAISYGGVRAIKVRLKGNRVIDCGSYKIDLPRGCINEFTGALERPEQLSKTLSEVPFLNGSEQSGGLVHLVIPKQLCYIARVQLSAAFRIGSLDRLKSDFRAVLPGDPADLVVDLHAPKTVGDKGSQGMLVAARRGLISDYIHVIERVGHSIASITSGEIARFNLVCLRDELALNRGLIIVNAALSGNEVSTWRDGLLDPPLAEGATISSMDLGDIDRIYLTGPNKFTVGKCNLNGDEISGRSLGALTDILSLKRTEKPEKAQPNEILSHAVDLKFILESASDSGEFDDALGAIAPCIKSERRGLMRKGYDIYQSHS